MSKRSPDRESEERTEEPAATPTPGAARSASDGAAGESDVFERPSALPRTATPARYLFLLVWMFCLPLAGAVGLVKVLKPKPYQLGVGMLRGFVNEQQVPATILFFTLIAALLWRLRHRLPMAGSMGIVGRSDLDASMRAHYDAATHLLEQTRRIMVLRRDEVRRHVERAERDRIAEAAERLEKEMVAETINQPAFQKAFQELERVAEQYLGAWGKSELREYTESIGIAVLVALLLRFFVIEAFKIPSGSMIPTLAIGDHIFVAKFAYGPLLPRSDTRILADLPPKRGDVIVFKFPENKKQDFIKRVVGLPNDRLEVIDGRPIINGLLIPNCYVGRIPMTFGSGHLYLEHLSGHSYLTMFDRKHRSLTCRQDRDCGLSNVCRSGFCGNLEGPYRVDKNEVFVLGDNRNNSHDSRRWRHNLGGGVPLQFIKGRAMFVWWSWDPRKGLNSDRFLVNVMGDPHLPQEAPGSLQGRLAACIKNTPPVAATTPPLP